MLAAWVQLVLGVAAHVEGAGGQCGGAAEVEGQQAEWERLAEHLNLTRQCALGWRRRAARAADPAPRCCVNGCLWLQRRADALCWGLGLG